ncbi:acyl carrier protein [Saccharothrix xinjiangensis]|uniref:Acyl carrier protein n=1 Tax=Saccharothrix xinjiangensis TaxID=204798 RepID=A0ABV9Y8V0_9PSEU
MSDVTMEDLMRVLAEAAGDVETADVAAADVPDTSFEDLGYDSLALIETAARLKRDFGVVLSDDDVVELSTPRSLLELVNRPG